MFKKTETIAYLPYIYSNKLNIPPSQKKSNMMKDLKEFLTMILKSPLNDIGMVPIYFLKLVRSNRWIIHRMVE